MDSNLDIVDCEPHDLLFQQGIIFASTDGGIVLHALQQAFPSGLGDQGAVTPDRPMDSLQDLCLGSTDYHIARGLAAFEQNLRVDQ